jgi:CheY-like chemotaxis protein
VVRGPEPTPLPILIVSADAASRAVLRDLLGADGHAVREVDSAEAALGFLATSQAKLLIADSPLPGMSGAALIRELRDTPGTERLPVIVLPFADDDVSHRALDAGAAACCTKPIPGDAFRQLVATVLDRVKRGVAPRRMTRD